MPEGLLLMASHEKAVRMSQEEVKVRSTDTGFTRYCKHTDTTPGQCPLQVTNQ